MTALNIQLDEKRNVVDGVLTQAKGVAREQWGKLSHNEQAQLTGKKDQIIGKLQANYGDSWIVRNKGWVLIGTAVTAIGLALAFIFTRSQNQESD